MAVSVRRFKAEFPEFKDTSEDVISANLSRASRQVNQNVWGAQADDGISLLTAHMLAMSPRGEQAKLKFKNRGTHYKEMYDDLVMQVTSGGRVI
jgi:hypothetical protein